MPSIVEKGWCIHGHQLFELHRVSDFLNIMILSIKFLSTQLKLAKINGQSKDRFRLTIFKCFLFPCQESVRVLNAKKQQ